MKTEHQWEAGSEEPETESISSEKKGCVEKTSVFFNRTSLGSPQAHNNYYSPVFIL